MAALTNRVPRVVREPFAAFSTHPRLIDRDPRQPAVRLPQVAWS